MAPAGRRSFTKAEIEQIRMRLHELRRADGTRQKTIRASLRSMGFRISDYTHNQQGFTVIDFDALLRRGVIESIDDGDQAHSAAPTASEDPTTHRRPLPRTAETGGASSDVDDLTASAIAALTGDGHDLATADQHVPDRPGLYAIHAGPSAWAQLGLGNPPDSRPLYVGKAEDSLVSRDLRTHFGDGRTGQSTVRRSIAALLHESLGLHAIPRNPAKPAYFSNYGLSPTDDAALTAWMRDNLRLAVWPKPDGAHLYGVEISVLQILAPPLNLKDVTTPWQLQLKAARSTMAAEAREWTPDT